MTLKPSIRAATLTDIPEVLAFTLQARAALFPKLSAAGAPADLAHFESTYLQGDGQFLIARHGGAIVAAIGYLPYDQRFPQLDFHAIKTVEVVRLFVLPAFRRGGLAGQLYRALKALARQNGVDALYRTRIPSCRVPSISGCAKASASSTSKLTLSGRPPTWNTASRRRFRGLLGKILRIRRMKPNYPVVPSLDHSSPSAF